MNKVIFSSWAGKVVDNRGLEPDKFADVRNLPLALEYNGRKLGALMSWNGLVVADERVHVVAMAHDYMKEVQKLSCGECTIGYLGVRIIVDMLGKVLAGKVTEKDIDWLEWLGTTIRDDARCDFCAQAVTPVLDTIKHYRDEYTKLMGGKGTVSKAAYVTRITAPCMEACPAHQDIPGYIELIRNRRYNEALALIRQTNCLPGTTGRACVAFCEEKCVRNDIDKPLAIRALKRFPADYEASSGVKPELKNKKGNGNKIAVIGAGPAGLAASFNLALKGYKVTVFDEQSSAGGMALVGIPAYRLPREVLGKEADIISGLGIELKLNTRLGRDITLEELSSQGFKAIFIATGAHMGREPDIENWKSEYEGLREGVEFLSDVNLGKKPAAKKRVIIVGGGNVAIDCARTCIRLGSKDVTIVYRRSRAEMPGQPEEIEEAEREGVKIHFLAVPVKVLAEGNKVVGAECIKMELGEPDASGRRRPVPVKGSEFVIDTDMILTATGEVPDLSFLSQAKAINTTEWGTVVVDQDVAQTSMPGVFSGGDCVSGPATLIEAIAAGNRAAGSIDRYLTEGSVTPSDEDVVGHMLSGIDLSERRDGRLVAKEERRSPDKMAVADRGASFDEVEQCLTAEAVAREAERCLRCYRVMLLVAASK